MISTNPSTIAKPSYGNWVPQKLLNICVAATLITLTLLILFLFRRISSTAWMHWLFFSLLSLLFAVKFSILSWAIRARRAFDYQAPNSLARRIIETVSQHIQVADNARILDVGCGSGALSIACARKNPQAQVIGVDFWGKAYDHYSQTRCESNAQAENIRNVVFQPGDARKLPFPDASFDAVTSNYVYHNIRGCDKQDLVLESLRLLKKGGVFAIHDLMGPRRYGDLQQLIKKLQAEGYESVRLIPTDCPPLMSRSDACALMLSGSMLLCGKK